MSDATDALNQITALRSELKARFADIELGFKSYDNTLSALQVMVGKVVTAEAMAKSAPVAVPPNLTKPPVPWQAISVGSKIAQQEVRPNDQHRAGDRRAQRGCTDRQANFIRQLLDDKFAKLNRNDLPLTMLGASQVIDKLKQMPDIADDDRDLTSVTVESATPPAEKVKDKININVLKMIPDGRYAVTADDGKQTVFLKLATRKDTASGRTSQYRDLRYKSSDSWFALQKFYPSGQVTGRNSVHGSVVADLLTQIMMDKGGCADRYGERFQECVNCGRELTDDRSRYYRLGSECIQHRHDVVEYIDSTRGPWTPGAASQD